jgi:hypothetical protein
VGEQVVVSAAKDFIGAYEAAVPRSTVVVAVEPPASLFMRCRRPRP